MVPVKPTVKPPPPTSKPPPPREPSCKPPPKPLLPASKPLVCNIYAAPNTLGAIVSTTTPTPTPSKPNISVVRTKISGAAASSSSNSSSSTSAGGESSSKSPHHAASQNGGEAVKLPRKSPVESSNCRSIAGDRTSTTISGETDGQTSSSRTDTRANSTDSGLSSAACDREGLMELSESLQSLLAGMEEQLTTQAAMSVSDKVSCDTSPPPLSLSHLYY